MLDLSWTEILVILVVAIIFIGPKDLPLALRMVGRWMGKARGMAREFQNNVDDMIREAELDEVRKQVQKLETGEFAREIEKAVDPKGELNTALKTPDFSLAGQSTDISGPPQVPPPADPAPALPPAEPPVTAPPAKA